MFGVIPGPVLFGLVLDGTCTFITKQCSSDFCSVYDVPKTRMSFFLWAFGSKVRREASGGGCGHTATTTTTTTHTHC